MSIFWTVLFFIIGLFFIIKGGDIFVDASVWIAEVLGMPKFLVGATIVSFATTLPELLVSIFAAVGGNNEIAVGNAVGSVTANVGLIMCISILVLPSIAKRSNTAFKGIMLVAIAALMVWFGFDKKITVIEAVVLLAIFAAYMAENIISAKKSLSSESDNKRETTKKEMVRNIFGFIVGIAAIVKGADLLVDKGSEIAKLFGIPEGIIAVTLVAIGTSLPELVTTITALIKKQSSLSVGNIIGANIIDLTLIMPICSVISNGSLPISKQGAMLDIPVCFAVCTIAIIPALISQKFRRWQGALLAVVYISYLIFMCVSF